MKLVSSVGLTSLNAKYTKDCNEQEKVLLQSFVFLAVMLVSSAGL